MRKAYVYALIDPRTKEIRYIGKAWDWQARKWEHCVAARKGEDGHKNFWIRSLLKEGLYPDIICLEECDDEKIALERERFWIAHHKALGTNLCNHTEGGDGILGFRHSEETKWAIAQANRFRKANPGVPYKSTRPKRKRGREKGFVTTEEQKRKMSETLTGRKIPEEVRKKIGDSLRGVPQGPCPISKVKSIAATKMLKRNKKTIEFYRILLIFPENVDFAFLIKAYTYKYYWRYQKEDRDSYKNSKERFFLPPLLR